MRMKALRTKLKVQIDNETRSFPGESQFRDRDESLAEVWCRNWTILYMTWVIDCRLPKRHFRNEMEIGIVRIWQFHFIILKTFFEQILLLKVSSCVIPKLLLKV